MIYNKDFRVNGKYPAEYHAVHNAAIHQPGNARDIIARNLRRLRRRGERELAQHLIRRVIWIGYPAR